MFNLASIKKKNICIIGLMGSGKSIIGKDLSKHLDFRFYDTDKEIELNTKKSINLIFKEEGETHFRKIEEKICLELLAYDNCVISLGGGSIINKKIRKLIKLNSYSIYLKVKIDNLLNRLKSSHKRPLINRSQNKKEILENLYKNRSKFYEKSDLIINNDFDKFTVLAEIKSKLKLYEK
tara:strand:+ start:3256 stop:3792 length:537 start_codon:yes stop_codon:yes gene_type:complete